MVNKQRFDRAVHFMRLGRSTSCRLPVQNPLHSPESESVFFSHDDWRRMTLHYGSRKHIFCPVSMDFFNQPCPHVGRRLRSRCFPSPGPGPIRTPEDSESRLGLRVGDVTVTGNRDLKAGVGGLTQAPSGDPAPTHPLCPIQIVFSRPGGPGTYLK
jgi:hypothetical protein